ncbi:MAG: hypothetical protein R3C49_02560 [Planctomycetaceae bacterium]
MKDVYLDDVVYSERNDRVRDLRALEGKYRDADTNVKQNQSRIDGLAEELGTGDSKVAIINQGLLQQSLGAMQSDLRALMEKFVKKNPSASIWKERGLPLDRLNTPLGGLDPTASHASAGAADPMINLRRQLMSVQGQIRQFRAFSRNDDHPDLLALLQVERDSKAAISGGLPDDDGLANLDFDMTH